jgi:hypothetical protein
MKYHKVLTRNDVGKTSHQSGFHVSKIDARSGLFPKLDESLRNNPRCVLKVLDRMSGEIFRANFIFYNKSKNEYRVTGVSPLFKLYGLTIGDVIYLEKKDDVWIFDYKRASRVIDRFVKTKKSKTGGHGHPLSSADRKPLEFSDDLDLILNPQKIKNGGQGYSTSSADRKAVEIHAMVMAKEWLRGERFTRISDCSDCSSFDFSAFKGSKGWKVEVKGTTQPSADAILMTSNEVELHRRERGSTVLVIVHSIRLDRAGPMPTATGGTIWAEVGWDIDKWIQTPTAFRVSR